MYFRFLDMKFNLDLVGIVDCQLINSGFLVGFLQDLEELLLFLEMMILKSSNDYDKLFGVVFGFLILNFRLGCILLIM